MARKMKDSGIAWIGEIPEGWENTKVKRIFNIGRGRVISQEELEPAGYPVYSSQTKNDGCLGYISTYDFDQSQLTWTTDGANAGTVFLRNGKYNCTNVCGTLAPKTTAHDLRYLKYALEYIAFYHKRADINGFKIMNNEMAEIQIILPSFYEQEHIANFLDYKCTQIQFLLEQSCTSIETYKKLKHAVITQAMTKGVRGERKMKDSGVEWIGEIPMEWKLAKIKSGTTKVGSGKTPSGGAEVYTESGILFLRSQNIYDGSVILDNPTYISEEVDETMKSTRVLPNDVLLNITGGSIGRCSIYPGVLGRANVNQHVCIIRTNPAIFSARYMQYFWISSLGHLAINLYQTGGNREGMSADAIRNTPIPYPSLNEQSEIADYLDAKCAEIDKLIAKKEQLVKELEGYKKSLIYEVVTGKREV